MPIKFTKDTVFDGFLELSGGVNSGWAPGLIPQNTLSFAWNCTGRGGYVTHRPARKRLPLNFGTDALMASRFVQGRFQGAEFYNLDGGTAYHIVSISGRQYKVVPDKDQATVEEITVRHQTLTTANFVIPVLNGTVVVSVQSTSNLNPNVTVQVGGFNFQVESVDAGASTLTLSNLDGTIGASVLAGSVLIFWDVNPAMIKQVWMVQAEKWMIIQDGQSVPIIWDGAQCKKSVLTLNQIQAGKMMVYHLGRVVKVNPDGKTFSIGDLVYSGTSGTSGENHRDAVLYVKENTFLAGGGFFTVPGNFGDITFLKGIAILDASLGQGPVQVGTPKAIFSCNLPVDRTTWQNLENPILTVSQIANGGVSQDSAVLVNGDLFYRAPDRSIRSLILGQRQFLTEWGNVPVSREMNRVLPFDDPKLLSYASGVLFDNRLLMTTSPSFSNRGIYHRGLVALDFDVLSGMRDKKPAAWDGLWLGVNTLKILAEDIGGDERCFEYVLSGTGEIELWELTRDEIKENGNIPVYWSFETSDFFRSGQNFHELDIKRLLNGELHIEDLKGRVDFWVYFRPDQHPCWIPWRKWYVCADEEACTVNEGGCVTNEIYQPQYRRRLPFGQPTNDCDPTTNRPYRQAGTFQVRIEVMGHCKITGLRLMATLVPEPLFGDLNDTCVDSLCDAAPETPVTYHNAPQTYTAECPVAEPIGDPVTVTIPAGAFATTVSQAEADALALAAAQAQAEAALNCMATYDVTVTVESGTVAADLTSFPLMIRLSDLPAAFWTHVAAEGGDLRAYTTGDVQIPIDMAWIDTGAEDGVIFVRQSLATGSDTGVVIKCGNGLGSLDPTDPNGRNAVWQDYERVFLFRNDLVDRTGNANATMTAGVASYNTSSLSSIGAGGGLVGNGTNKARTTGLSGSSVFTMGASVELDALATTQVALCNTISTGVAGSNEVILYFRPPSNEWATYSNSADGLLGSGVAPTANGAARVHVRHNGTTDREIYVNGVSKATDTTIIAIGASDNWLNILTDTAGNALVGTVGFVYIRYHSLTDDWIAAEYANASSPSTFYTVTVP